jgi:hypothetical protein
MLMGLFSSRFVRQSVGVAMGLSLPVAGCHLEVYRSAGMPGCAQVPAVVPV